MNKLGNQSIQYGIKGIYSIWIVVYFEGTIIKKGQLRLLRKAIQIPRFLVTDNNSLKLLCT